MSITNALNNAASGLAASARLADTISNNVANAMTAGLRPAHDRALVARARRLRLGGARRARPRRAENPYLTAERRGMDAALGGHRRALDAYERLLAAMGEPGDGNALSTLATALETTLMSAAASPQSAAKLADAVNAGRRRWPASLNRIADENVAAAHRGRRRDRPAGRPGERRRCTRSTTSTARSPALAPQGVDVTALQDERGRLIDGISAIVPVRAVKRDGDQIALYSAERRGAARRPGLRAELHAGAERGDRPT